MTDADGINIPVDGKYADQKRVYNECGSDILVNAWYNFIYLGKGIIAACSHMARLVQARATR